VLPVLHATALHAGLERIFTKDPNRLPHSPFHRGMLKSPNGVIRISVMEPGAIKTEEGTSIHWFSNPPPKLAKSISVPAGGKKMPSGVLVVAAVPFAKRSSFVNEPNVV
jgi:hypothetical protein